MAGVAQGDGGPSLEVSHDEIVNLLGCFGRHFLNQYGSGEMLDLKSEAALRFTANSGAPHETVSFVVTKRALASSSPSAPVAPASASASPAGVEMEGEAEEKGESSPAPFSLAEPMRAMQKLKRWTNDLLDSSLHYDGNQKESFVYQEQPPPDPGFVD